MIGAGVYVGVKMQREQREFEESNRVQEVTIKNATPAGPRLSENDRRIVDMLTDGPFVETTAFAMVEAHKNEVAAERRFRGQAVRVTGRVRRIEIAGQGQSVVRLSGAVLRDVVCVSYNQDTAAQLKSGDRIVVRGLGAGIYITDPILNPCVVEP